MDMDFTTATSDFTTVPFDFTTVPFDFTTVPSDFTTVPSDFTTVPSDFTFSGALAQTPTVMEVQVQRPASLLVPSKTGSKYGPKRDRPSFSAVQDLSNGMNALSVLHRSRGTHSNGSPHPFPIPCLPTHRRPANTTTSFWTEGVHSNSNNTNTNKCNVTERMVL